MAGKVKKGFGTYLFMLLLMLIATVLIILLVMIFSPFRKIAGYQYIYYENDYIEYNVTGGSSDSIFDLSSLEEIKINCNYATVSVERSDDIDKNMVKITNSAKGFAYADANVDFSYKLYYENGSEDKVLCIDVHEPEASVYFSKKVEIAIVLPDDKAVNLTNVTLNIANTSGDVFVAYHSNADNSISVAGLNIKTNSGGVYLGKLLNSHMEEVFINSENGGVTSLIDIIASDSFSLIAKSGDLQFQNISLGSSLATMNLGNSEFKAGLVVGNIDLQIADGYIDIDKLIGDISGNNPAEQLTTSTITIGEVGGNVSFPFANASKIRIEKLSNGKLYVNGTSGYVKVGELNGYAWIEMTSGNVELKANCDFEVKTTTGKIKVDYTGETIANKVSLISESGEVNLSVNPTLAFTLHVFDVSGNLRTANNVSVEGFDSNFEIPLEINGGGSAMEVTTNAKVNVELYKVA
ncbi:MAG: DUF4097 family beta strand repeat protein [Clostridia bacterium]|nr:DUF4097 family beta strand repeat protein [Clostridia bacterium]MBQ8792490.1 DUF4097 family beta strand repeat protein [Clostridia bacterium]